jgi:hypothetical protein
MTDNYRKTARPKPPPAGELVTVRTYFDALSAEIDRANLASQGIQAFVAEATSSNLVWGSAVAARLQVSSHDFVRSCAVLEEKAPEESAGDDEELGVVRCPRCELAYCVREKEGAWCCQRCDHRWDDAEAGPLAVTRLEVGDPRPVFRLRRTHGGLGFFVGLVAAFLIGAVTLHGGLGFLAAAGAILIGWLVGRSFRYEVCSVPDCRAALGPGDEECASCGGTIAGVIRSASEHYAAAADFRRELSDIRRRDRAKKLEKRKKRPALPQ